MKEQVHDVFSLNRVQLMELIKLTVAQTYPEELSYKNRNTNHIKNVVNISKYYSPSLPGIDTCQTVEEYNELIDKVKENCINNAEKIEQKLEKTREESILRIKDIIDKEWDFNQEVRFHSNDEINQEFGCTYEVMNYNNENFEQFISGNSTFNGFDSSYGTFGAGIKTVQGRITAIEDEFKKIKDINFFDINSVISYADVSFFDPAKCKIYLSRYDFFSEVRSSYFVELLIKFNGYKRYLLAVYEYLINYLDIYVNGGGAWHVYNKYNRRPNKDDCAKFGISNISIFKFNSVINKAKNDLDLLSFPDINHYYNEELVKWNEDHEDYNKLKLRKEDLNLDELFIKDLLINTEEYFYKKRYGCGNTHSFITKAHDSSLPYPLIVENLKKYEISKTDSDEKYGIVFERNEGIKLFPIKNSLSKDSSNFKLLYDLEKPFIPFITLIINEHRRYEKKIKEIQKKYHYGTVFPKINKLSFNSQDSRVGMTSVLDKRLDNAMISYLNQHKVSRELDEKNANLITCFPKSYQEIQIGTMNRSNNLIMIYKILEDGRADSWKEAVNLLEDDKFKRNVVASLGEIKNGIHSVVYQIAEEGKKLNETIAQEFSSTRNVLEKNDKDMKRIINKNSDTTNKNLSNIKNSADSLNSKSEKIIENTLDIPSIFSYLYS